MSVAAPCPLASRPPALSITVTSLEQAVEEHPELVEPWLGRRLPVDEGKFAAANAAFWTGGAFIHVPKNTQLEKPIQVVYLIDEPGTAQYAHTQKLLVMFVSKGTIYVVDKSK